MKRNPITIKVSEDFRRVLKENAAKEGCSIIEYTKKLASKTKKDSLRGFDFKI